MKLNANLKDTLETNQHENKPDAGVFSPSGTSPPAFVVLCTDCSIHSETGLAYNTKRFMLETSDESGEGSGSVHPLQHKLTFAESPAKEDAKTSFR